MSRPVMLIGKIVTILLWILAVLAMMGFVPAPLNKFVVGFAVLVLGVHVLEVVYLFRTCRGRVVQPVAAVVQVLVFGVFSLQPLLNEGSDGEE